MAFIAKTDVQMSFELQGAAAFYMCARLAMERPGWSRAEPYPDALRRMVKDRLPDFDDADLDKLIRVGEAVCRRRSDLCRAHNERSRSDKSNLRRVSATHLRSH